MKKTSEKIIGYLRSKRQATPADLSTYLNINRQATHRQISKLLQAGVIYKIGRPPKVFYLIKDPQKKKLGNMVSEGLKKLIDENYLIITPAGKREEGFQGFVYWCDKHNLPLEKTAIEYQQTLKKYSRYRKNGLINGGYKMKHTFTEVYLDRVFYLDFYSIERFGKTKLGQLLLYAKQSQNRDLIRELVNQIRPKVEDLVQKFSVEAVGFVPPTVKRETQLMKELEKQLSLPIPTLSLVKVKTPVAVAQKTLTKLEDRIENARDTIIVDDSRKYKNILLIDDALGSGATMNETARKIKKQGVAKTVIGLAITGSFSGFEIISEV